MILGRLSAGSVPLRSGADSRLFVVTGATSSLCSSGLTGARWNSFDVSPKLGNNVGAEVSFTKFADLDEDADGRSLRGEWHFLKTVADSTSTIVRDR